MATNFEDIFSAQMSSKGRPLSEYAEGSTTSTDSGYESRNYIFSVPESPNRESIVGFVDPECQAAPSVGEERMKKHSKNFQCALCPKRFTRACNLRSHSRIHTDEGPFICTICGKAFVHQRDRKRHEGRHSGEKFFVCKGELKQNGQWGCGRRFAHADALSQHFCAEAERICIKPLLDEEAIERQRDWQEEHRTEQNIPKNQEMVSACPVDEPGNYCFAATSLEFPDDVGYDGVLSGSSSFNLDDAVYWSDIDAGYTAIQLSIEEILEEPAAARPSKERDTDTVLEGDCAVKVPGKSQPKDSTDDNIEPSAIAKVTQEDQLIPNKLSKKSENSAREPNPTNINRRTESPPLDEVSGDYDYLSAASTTESDFEDNESSEAETTSSEAPSESSFISPIIEAYKRDAVESLMIEFEALLDRNLGVRSRATSTGSSNGSSPPRSSAERPSQQGVSGRGKRKERDEDGSGSGSSGGDGDDDRRKKAHLEGSSQDLSPRKFACPYYRRNSQKHKKNRSCAGPGWISVHRVKEHIFRQHCLPIHCHRCCTIFKIESDLAAHQRLPQGCEVRVLELPEGCSKEQEKLLRKRKRGSGSEENKWKDMFQCLFPEDNEDMIPTPYYDDEQVAAWESRRDDEFAQYEQYLSQELPRVVRRRLEQVVSESTKPFESELRSQLVDIVRDVQSTLFRSYRQTNMPRSSSALLEQEEIEADQAQTDSKFQEPPPIFDFSAFCAPPPVADNYSNPIGVDISVSSWDPAGNYQPTSDSGYGSNNLSFDVSGGHDSGTNGECPNIFNDEAAPPPTWQGSHQNLDRWFQ